MTRILALGDSQLGATTVELDDQEKVWDRIVDVAIDRNVDLVLHAGDLLEGPIVHPEHLRAFRRPLRRLRERGIPMLVIRGNHDRAVRPVDGLDVFHEYGLLTIVQRPEAHEIADVRICCLPWVHPGNLIAQFGDGVDHDLVNRQAESLLVRIARDLRVDGKPNVLVAHWAISGSKLPTGLPVDEMREPILPWAELDALGYDAICGGHIHFGAQISQPLVDQTLGIVVGSPQPLNHGEGGYPHGVWLLDITPEMRPLAEFIEIESKRFITIDAESPGALYQQPWGVREGDVVRVRVAATEEEMLAWKQDTLREALIFEGASRVDIRPLIVRKARARVETISDQLSKTEALAAWCDENEVGAEMRERMIARLHEWA